MIMVIRVSCQVQVAQPMALGIRILAIWFYLACCEFVFSLPLISPEIPWDPLRSPEIPWDPLRSPESSKFFEPYIKSWILFALQKDFQQEIYQGHGQNCTLIVARHTHTDVYIAHETKYMVILWTSLLAQKLADTPSISRALEVNIHAVHAHRILMFSPWAAGRLKHVLEESYWTPRRHTFLKVSDSFSLVFLWSSSDLRPSERVLPVTFTVQRENCTGPFFSRLAMLWSI